jgi:isocitrate dehydrogenase
MMKKHPITVAYGDGIGPEIMKATLDILTAAKAPIEPEIIEVGEKVYLSGNSTGIGQEAWDSLNRTKVLLKSPITTPQGGGYKSLNVTIRKSMGLYANVRPCRAYAPYVPTTHPQMDLVIVRENEEDLYAGIEYRQSQGAYECVKLITVDGCRRIVQYAFEYARQFNRKKVTCMSKDNIMKMADGLFHRTFREIAELYPDIETDHYIIDIGTARVASQPELFDVIVTENLYGDIISDVAAEVVGSVGLAGSANVGSEIAMFEAIHGSAPDIAGQDIANPSGLLSGAIQMLIHLGAHQVASRIENAWLRTLEDGIHTGDIYRPEHSKHKVGTQAFAEAVIERLGNEPIYFKPSDYKPSKNSAKLVVLPEPEIVDKSLIGIDIFIDLATCGPDALGDRVTALELPLTLQVIGNRGVKVWPEGQSQTHCADFWRLRLVGADDYQTAIDHQTVLQTITKLIDDGFAIVKTDCLYFYNDERGFSLIQGQ